MKRKLVVELISFLLMLIFLYAAFSKWFAFKTFRDEINNQPYPNWLTPWIIYSIPPLEVLITLALMFERTRKVGLYASLILMSVFSMYTIAVMLNFFAYVPCSCGGIIKDLAWIKNLSWNQHLLLNLFMVAISIVGIVLHKNRFNKDRPTKSMVVAS
jgi:putative oxidoreductase